MSLPSRQLLVGLLLALLALLGRPHLAEAEEVAVPVGLQAELLAKVAGYDKNLTARAGDKVHVLIVTKPGDADSTSVAAHMDRSLRAIGDIGGLAHDEATIAYTGPEALAKTVKASRIAIVYFAPGFRDDAAAIARALEGTSVLSAGALADYVPKGVVLGFDLVSGKPKMVIHLGQAKKQDVAFRAEVLKLARVIE